MMKKGLDMSDFHLHLYLMRHGQSHVGGVWGDFNRSLTRTGKRSVRRQAICLSQPEGIRPDCIFCSTANRSRQTAALLASVFVGTSVFPRESLYLAPAFRILKVLRETDVIFRRILLIGHAPGLDQLTAVLTHPDNHFHFDPADCLALTLSVPNWQDLQTGSAFVDACFRAA
jgi:phosphohistidine phosphatase